MIETPANPRYATGMTLKHIAQWFASMALLLALTALCQAIGGQRYGLTLASAAGFGAGYGLHAAIVRRKAR